MSDDHKIWISATMKMIRSHRRNVDAAVGQLTDEELFKPAAPDTNSVATTLRHLGGNLQSRWTDFLTTDGEKPTRNRDLEFKKWQGDRESLMRYFDEGWKLLTSTIGSLQPSDMHKTVFIRGDLHSVPQAIMRSITHIAYHTGQIMLIARMVHDGDWEWLTIAPGQSRQHNESVWKKQ